MRREGAELWFYACCHPLGRYPNRFLDQPGRCGSALNGEAVANVRPSGYFSRAVFLGDNQPTITVSIEVSGQKRTVTRTFKLTD